MRPDGGMYFFARRIMIHYGNLRANETGIYFGGDGKKLAYHYRGDRHIIWLGPTGVGKDTSIITPLLARLRRSVYVVDPEAQQFAMTARARSRFSKIIVRNPYRVFADRWPRLKMTGGNLLIWIDPKSPTFVDDCVEVARSIVVIDPLDPQKYFSNSAIALLAALIIWAILKYGRKANLAMVRDMLCDSIGEDANGDPIGLSKTVGDIMAWAERDPLGRAARNKISDFKNITRGLLDVRGSARTATDFLDSVPIREDMSRDGFDFRRMRDEIVTVYLINPRMSKQPTWLRLELSAVLKALMETPPNPLMPKPLLLFNEVAQAGHFELLVEAHGRSRKWFQIISFWQSLMGQMKPLYKDSMHAIIGSRGCLSSFAPLDWETARYLSDLSGQYGEVINSRNFKPDDPSGSSSENVKSFPIIRPEDIMRLAKGTTINFVDGVKYPFLASTPPYWELPQFRKYLDSDPYHTS